MRTGGATRQAFDGDLALRTLGGASLLRVDAVGDQALLFGPGKPVALLAFVASAPNRSVHKEHLVDLLWSNLSVGPAKHALRQTVWSIRKRVGDGVIITHDNALAVPEGVKADRDTFLRAVQDVELDRAIELYTGDFLAGLTSVGSAEFEQWADNERYRLRLILRRTAEVAVRRRLAEGRFRYALYLARLIRNGDRRYQGGWRLLLEALMAADDPVAAEMEADALESMLASEARPPETETETVIKTVRQFSSFEGFRAPHPPLPPLTSDLVGRERYFAALMAAWRRVQHGHFQHIHVTGGVGVGKTRLLTDLQQRLLASSGRAAYLPAHLGTRRIPYGLAGDLAGVIGKLPGVMAISPHAARALVSLHPGLSTRFSAAPDETTGDPGLRKRIVALAEAFSTVCDEGPLAILLDDVHWCDTISGRVLGALWARLSASQLFVVTAGQPADQGAVLPSVTQRFDLLPLSVTEVQTVIENIGDVPDREWAREMPQLLHHATGGLPLLVLDTLRRAIEHGRLALGPDGWTCHDRATFGEWALRAPIRHRVARLDGFRRWLLTLVCTAGAPLSVAELAACTALSEDTILSHASVLERQGLLARSASGWSPAGHLVAQLVMDAATPEAVHRARSTLTTSTAPARRGWSHPFRRWIITAVAIGIAGGAIGFATAQIIGTADRPQIQEPSNQTGPDSDTS